MGFRVKKTKKISKESKERLGCGSEAEHFPSMLEAQAQQRAG